MSGCFCTGACKVTGRCPNVQPALLLPTEAPGLHKLALPEFCRDPEHNMPTHLHIPGGHKFVHYCPSCRHKSVAIGLEVTCSA